ncbi:MAG TPA: Na+/H+ antiporter NhaA [Candidatus Limnocylindrales bacterium]|nr:Na+/H+ antiporter NhaA [Candidatus Limnocylindrales bacterium]
MQPIDRAMAPLRQFTASSASGGVLLMIAAVIALVWANSPFWESYEALWATPLSIGLGEVGLTKPLILWINDGLMAIFFLVVGLEIKREVLVGELATVRRASLPIAAAAGGAAIPAIIYTVIAAGAGGDASRGWGIPMATDIAFALGVLALVGRRAPVALKIFLTALAIVDDLIAVLVIAIFYTANLSFVALGVAAVTLVLLVAANLAGVRRPMVYAVLGVVLWIAVLQSGVHATIAGVLLALTIPATVRLDGHEFAEQARRLVARVDHRPGDGGGRLRARHASLWELEDLTERAQSPMMRIEHALHPWVAFLIVPLFALANAGVRIVDRDVEAVLTEPIFLGVALGLLLGKQVGITLATWLIVRSGLASLPQGVGWRHVYGVSWLGAIGFTMSLFIADLAFADAGSLALAKVGILVASLIAGIVGFTILRTTRPQPGHHAKEGDHAGPH